MEKIKIAVLLSGLTRYWEITSKCFEYWNNFHDNVDYYFFISTWGEPTRAEKSTYARSPIKLPPSGFEKNDFSKYPFLTKYEYINQEEFTMAEGKGNPNTQYYAYSLYKCNELRKSSGINFDGVIHTRTDIFIPKEIHSKIISLFGCPKGASKDFSPDKMQNYKKNKVQPEMFFTTSGTTIALAKPKNRFFINNDNFSFAHPLAMDKYANMYFDSYVHKKNPSTSLHSIQAEQLMLHRIYNSCMGGQTWLVRSEKLGLQKYGMPTSEDLEYVINTKGIDYLYNTEFVDLQKKYFSHDIGVNLIKSRNKNNEKVAT
jgi:hypothetical protein